MPSVPELLTFEKQWRKHTGAKELAIMERFGIKPPRYYVALDRATDTLEAARHAPILTRQLREQRERRDATLRQRLAS